MRCVRDFSGESLSRSAIPSAAAARPTPALRRALPRWPAAASWPSAARPTPRPPRWLSAACCRDVYRALLRARQRVAGFAGFPARRATFVTAVRLSAGGSGCKRAGAEEIFARDPLNRENSTVAQRVDSVLLYGNGVAWLGTDFHAFSGLTDAPRCAWSPLATAIVAGSLQNRVLRRSAEMRSVKTLALALVAFGGLSAARACGPRTVGAYAPAAPPGVCCASPALLPLPESVDRTGTAAASLSRGANGRQLRCCQSEPLLRPSRPAGQLSAPSAAPGTMPSPSASDRFAATCMERPPAARPLAATVRDGPAGCRRSLRAGQRRLCGDGLL